MLPTLRNIFLLLILFNLICICLSQSGCSLKGTFNCEGGVIKGINFGEGGDDDYFEYYSEGYVDNEQCGVYQLGIYQQIEAEVIAKFDPVDCYKSGNNPKCICISTLTFFMQNNCATAIGPNGEICEAAPRKIWIS